MKVDFKKYPDGLVPAIIQDFTTQKVLMLGFMNEEAFKKTEELGKSLFIAVVKSGYGPKERRVGIFYW